MSSSSMSTMQGAFTASMSDLISYRYIGCQAEMIDADHSITTTALRSHLYTPGSVSAATLGVSMLDAAGILVDRVHLLGLTEVDLQLYEPAFDVEQAEDLRHRRAVGRSQVFTECRFEDAARPGHVLGVGAANWSVLAPTPDGFESTDPGSGYPEGPDTPTMQDAYTLQARPEGGYVVPELSTTVGAEVLHHGPMFVGLELAALEAASAAAGTDPARAGLVVDADRPGRSQGPVPGHRRGPLRERRGRRVPGGADRRRRRRGRPRPHHVPPLTIAPPALDGRHDRHCAEPRPRRMTRDMSHIDGLWHSTIMAEDYDDLLRPLRELFGAVVDARPPHGASPRSGAAAA